MSDYGYHPWAPGEVVAAADLNLLADQGFPTFNNAASRDATWPAPPIGARSVLLDDPGASWYYAGTGSGWHRQGFTPVGRNAGHGLFAQGDPANGAVSWCSITAPQRVGRLYRVMVRCQFNLASATVATVGFEITSAVGGGSWWRVASRHIVSGYWVCVSGVKWFVSATDRPDAVWRAYLNSNTIVCARRDCHLYVDDFGPYPGAPLPPGD